MTMISYTPPAVTDHGSLVDLTADFDLTFVGSVAKAVSLAAVSVPVVGPNPPGGEVPVPNGPAGVPETVNVLGGGGGAPDVVNEGPSVLPDASSGGPGGGTSAPGGGAGGVMGSGGSGGGGSAGGGGGGDLPFTGYYATLSAAAGAALTTAGVTLRSKLRRKS